MSVTFFSSLHFRPWVFLSEFCTRQLLTVSNSIISENGKPLNFRTFFDFIVSLRRDISNRQLVSQSFVVAPADEEGKTGQVAHTTHFSGVQDGKDVEGTIVSVLNIGTDKGQRIIKTESFVFDTRVKKSM